jgi:hypothetical protein
MSKRNIWYEFIANAQLLHTFSLSSCNLSLTEAGRGLKILPVKINFNERGVFQEIDPNDRKPMDV